MSNYFSNFERIIFLILVCFPFVATGCDQPGSLTFSKTQKQSEGKPSDLVVNAMRVTRVESATETAVFFGTLKPNRQSQLRFGRGGSIKELPKNIGETLKAGERIASLELAQLEQQKQALEKSIQEANQDFQPDSRNLQQLQSQLQSVESELVKGTISAPYDCVIAAQNVVVGSLVSPQSSIVTVIEAQPVLVESSLPTKIAQELSSGRMVWVAVGDQAVKAQVKSRSPNESAAGSRVVNFEIADLVDPIDWSFGQTVKIRFLINNNNSGYWLPVSALRRESTGLWSSLVVAGKNSSESVGSSKTVVQRKMLQLIQLSDDWALVQGAFAENEFVVVNGLNRVVPGQLVMANDVSSQFVKPSAGARE